jgi:hypothetical protein
MNSENSSIAAENPESSDLSLGNLTTFKSPPKHHGILHQFNLFLLADASNVIIDQAQGSRESFFFTYK